MSTERPAIDILLRLAADDPDKVLQHLRTHPELASRQDQNGYSLVHAAASYDHKELLKALIEEFNVDPNIKDAFGETCIFNCESVEMARELVRLGVRVDAVNDEGQKAVEYLDDEDESPEVAAFLRTVLDGQSNGVASTSTNQGGNFSNQANDVINEETANTHAPPPLPDGVKVNIGTMQADDIGEEPDPEFRRRIEELASRQDFEGEEGQRQLRNLVEDAISGLGGEGQGPATRRRVE